jgi:triacylglycerol lipase
MLVVGFFDSDSDVSEFDHKVTTAYRWPVDVFAEQLTEAGFTEVERLQHQVGAALLTAPAAAANTHYPVLLVHGAIGSSRNFDAMAERLRDDGYRPYTVDFPFPATDSVADARLIAERVQQILAETGAAKVHLVAQSLGGIAARYYLRELGGLAHVATYTAIGTAQHGISSPVSCLTIPDTCPSGPVLQAINAGDDTPGAILYT